MDNGPVELIDRLVAVRIRARRLGQGITLQALAREIGVAFQQAHKYERGLSRITAGRLYHVACALSVPVGFFFAGGDAPPPEESAGVAGPRGIPRGAPASTHRNGADAAAAPQPEHQIHAANVNEPRAT
jgi:transcriptional regulator with XRE-family HTH domain